jgi:hypothetical protein
MSFDKTFCPSPWFHMRINNSGTYEFCRWQNKTQQQLREDTNNNIDKISPLEYFHTVMSSTRSQLLNSELVAGCQDCHAMEQHHKVSGRQRQLLKVGVMAEHFTASLPSNTYHKDFVYSANHSGNTLRQVRDWHIDLGNYCNSQCVMCRPSSSSRLADEFKTIGLIDALPPASWCNNPVLLDRFISDLLQCTDIEYLHFIGGEPLITPGFRKILQAVIDQGLSEQITVGFTTNLTVAPGDVVDLLSRFRQVHLGLSIETIDPVNDYIRYPSRISRTKDLLDQWVDVGRNSNWLTQLRITPTWLSVSRLVTVYDYAWQHGLSVESCNFLSDPAELRITVLPREYLDKARNKIAQWVQQHKAKQNLAVVVNTRNPSLVQNQIIQDALSYISYIDTAIDESHRLPAAVKFIKQLEHSRRNSIVDYLPEYHELLRSHGY